MRKRLLALFLAGLTLGAVLLFPTLGQATHVAAGNFACSYQGAVDLTKRLNPDGSVTTNAAWAMSLNPKFNLPYLWASSDSLVRCAGSVRIGNDLYVLSPTNAAPITSPGVRWGSNTLTAQTGAGEGSAAPLGQGEICGESRGNGTWSTTGLVMTKNGITITGAMNGSYQFRLHSTLGHFTGTITALGDKTGLAIPLVSTFNFIPAGFPIPTYSPPGSGPQTCARGDINDDIQVARVDGVLETY